MLPLLLACLALGAAVSGQRYAERNVPPAPSPSDSSYGEDGDYSYYDDYNYDGRDKDPFGFREDDGPDVYKWNVEQYPHPVETPKYCNRFKPSHVCDPDLVLEKGQADLLDDFILKLYKETPCICESCKNEGEGGIVVGIALLKYLHHPYHMHHAKVIRSFAESLRARWKLGPCENDILIVVATTDRLSYTDVGRATSSYLSLHEAHRIFLENKAKFTANNFSEGLMDILKGYHRATRGMQRALKDNRPDMDVITVAGAIVGSVVLVGALLFLGFIVYRRCKSRKDVDDNDDDDEPGKRRSGATVSSSWSKKDIKVLFGAEKMSSSPKQQRSSAKYEKCNTDEKDGGGNGARDEDDDIDFTLATPDDVSFSQKEGDETRLTEVVTSSSSQDVDLEKDLTKAAEGLVKTFPASPNGRGNVLVTDI